MCVLIFCTTSDRNISHYKQNSARYDHKCTLIFKKSIRYPFQNLIKLEFSRQIIEKYSNIKFHENPSTGCRVVAEDGRTDKHDEASSSSLQFCERA
jgi:hypothetical protein